MSKNFYKSFVITSLFLFTVIYKTNARISRIELKAAGLTCSMCSNAIFKQLKAIPEVDNVKTDLNSNTFVITIKNDKIVSPIVFKSKVEDAGFFIGSFIVVASENFLPKTNYIVIEGNNKKATEVKFQILDKGYVTEKEFKKLSKQYSKILTYILSNDNDFHIKILS
jgi:copper chaperone CopZ